MSQPLLTNKPKLWSLWVFTILGFLISLTLFINKAFSDEPLMVDLTDRFVEITTGFTGKAVTLFGATDEVSDILMVIEGPSIDLTIREKGKVAGIWTNINQQEITSVPSFYHVASSKPFATFSEEDIFSDWEIGLKYLTFDSPKDLTQIDVQRYHDAITELMSLKSLYVSAPNTIEFPRKRLFKTTINFPDNVPTGTYSVTVYMVQNGQITDTDNSAILISKTGFSAWIYTVAQRNAALYGLCAVLCALFAGWLGSVIFQKR